jgi:hypothetical protein
MVGNSSGISKRLWNLDLSKMATVGHFEGERKFFFGLIWGEIQMKSKKKLLLYLMVTYA